MADADGIQGIEVVIAAGRRKRRLRAPFVLIGQTSELRDMARQIMEQVGGDDEPDTFGSVYVTERYIAHPATINQAPEEWDA